MKETIPDTGTQIKEAERADMDIFELVDNDKFFNPLSSQNRRIYYECIISLIEKSKEVPVLYDSDARNCVAIYLKNSKYVFQGEYGEEEQEQQAPDRSASAVMAYLRECGWVTPREIGRNGENVANVSVSCRRIIEFLRKMCEKGNDGALSNHILSMYDILKEGTEEDSVRAQRPYSLILKPLTEHAEELKNELLDLKDSIASIMRIVMELQDANSVGKFLMKDELLDKFFNDYFFLKNSGMIPSRLSFIKNKLRVIEQGQIFENMAAECAAVQHLGSAEAAEKVQAALSGLGYFISVDYEENMELIDARINTYYNLANIRMMLVMCNGVNMESLLDGFLSTLKGMESGERQQALDKAADCMRISSQKYIGRKSYERRKRRERDNSAIGLPICDISQEEKELRTQEIMSGTKNRFSIECTQRFLEERMAGKKELELKEQRIGDREEALLFAASVMYSGIEEFPYAVELKDDYVETDIARMSNMKIKKR